MSTELSKINGQRNFLLFNLSVLTLWDILRKGKLNWERRRNLRGCEGVKQTLKTVAQSKTYVLVSIDVPLCPQREVSLLTFKAKF